MLIFIALIVITLAISGIASILVKSRFRRGKQVPLSSGMTGAEVARLILRHKGIDDVQVVETPGFLSDHYNPGSKQLALSRDVYHGSTAAAAGVAAHEVGHAIQHAFGSWSLGMRSVLAPAAGIGSGIAPYIIFAGAIMGGFQQINVGAEWGMGAYLTVAGIGLFSMFTLFTLVTVPNEFDASAKATVVLGDMGVIRPGPETSAVKGVLNAAGLTYVAAAVTSILWLLYYLLPLLLGNRD